jgi:hypothetical protein
METAALSADYVSPDLGSFVGSFGLEIWNHIKLTTGKVSGMAGVGK